MNDHPVLVCLTSAACQAAITLVILYYDTDLLFTATAVLLMNYRLLDKLSAQAPGLFIEGGSGILQALCPLQQVTVAAFIPHLMCFVYPCHIVLWLQHSIRQLFGHMLSREYL